MKKYKHIFFDLDRTLWDFDTNSANTIAEIVDRFNLQHVVNNKQDFIEKYNKHNDAAWDLYREKKLTKAALRIERFRLLLAEYGITDENLIEKTHLFYMEHSPEKPSLIDGAKDLLEYLNPNYNLNIISNGFYETQIRKLKAANIESYFYKVFTSDRIEVSKPDKNFFRHAIRSVNAKKAESIVIGDDIGNDIVGAFRFGLDQIWYNPTKEDVPFNPTYEVMNLKEIMDIL